MHDPILNEAHGEESFSNLCGGLMRDEGAVELRGSEQVSRENISVEEDQNTRHETTVLDSSLFLDPEFIRRLFSRSRIDPPTHGTIAPPILDTQAQMDESVAEERRREDVCSSVHQT